MLETTALLQSSSKNEYHIQLGRADPKQAVWLHQKFEHCTNVRGGPALLQFPPPLQRCGIAQARLPSSIWAPRSTA